MNVTTPFASLQLEAVGTSWLSVTLWIMLTTAGLVILGAIYWGIFQRSERRLTWLLMLLRGAGLLALLLALAKPTLTAEKQLVDAGRVAIVLDNSQSMSLPDASGKSRYVLATEAVARLRKALESGRDGTRLEVDLFDITGTPLSKNEAPAQPLVERTDLALALSKTSAALRFKPFNGVVLISDGMDNTGRESFQELGDIAAGKPIFTVGFKSDRSAGEFDLALKPVRQPPERAMVNNDIKVEVQVTKTGGPATQATVVIKRGLDERFAEQKIALPEGNDERMVSLTLKPTQAGTFEFTAAVESAVGERNLANNSWRFPLRVDAEPIRVLYLEGFLRYEYKFLKTRLEDDPDLNVAAIVRRANPEIAEPKSGKDLITPAQLKNFDVVILGDMEANYLSASEYEALVGWLDDKGHALLVLGGYRSFGPDGFRTTKLADVLPVVFADKPPSQSEEPFLLHLTEEGRTHPVFEVSSDRTRNTETWKEAPKLAGCSLVQRAKPGAEVLAVNPDITVEGKPAIVVATQRYGAGRTMILAADTTWRWSRFTRVLGQSDTLYARFWSQTLRWLAGRSLDDKRPVLSVSTDHPGYDVGKRVDITVTRQPRPELDLAKAELEVKVADAAGKTITIPMKASSAAPDEFKGGFSPTVGGRYQVLAALTEGGKPLANQATEFLVHGSNLELADTGCNAENLKALAGASGGAYRDVAEAEKLADQIPRKERRITQRQVSQLWNRWELFVVFIGAVSAEWFIRRRSHLV